jgi:hypothetical protein
VEKGERMEKHLLITRFDSARAERFGHSAEVSSAVHVGRRIGREKSNSDAWPNAFDRNR